MHRKIALQFLVSNASTAASFVLSLVLSRILSPGEIGLFSMGAVLVAFSHVFRDFGVVSFLKRQKELTPAVLGPASGLLYATSWTMALTLFLGAGLWARFLGHAEVKQVVQVLALGFVFIPMGAIPQALMHREMDVRKTSLITLVASGVHVGTSIWFALAGFGYMSMPWANLVNILATALLSHLLRPEGISYWPTFRGWRGVAGFGAGAITSNSLRSLDSALPDILLGRLGSADLVGLQSRANSTVGIISTVVTPTVQYFSLPYLARKFHEQSNISAEVAFATQLLAGMVWPALFFAAIMAGPLINVLYGDQWAASVAAMPWLCVATAVSALFTLSGPALTGLGRPYVAAVPVSVALVLKVGLAVILFDGTLLSFSKALAFGEIGAAPLQFLVLQRMIGIRIASYLQASIRPLVLACAVGMATFVTKMALQQNVPVVQLAVGAGVALVTWLAGGWWLQAAAVVEPLKLWTNRGKSVVS